MVDNFPVILYKIVSDLDGLAVAVDHIFCFVIADELIFAVISILITGKS